MSNIFSGTDSQKAKNLMELLSHGRERIRLSSRGTPDKSRKLDPTPAAWGTRSVLPSFDVPLNEPTSHPGWIELWSRLPTNQNAALEQKLVKFHLTRMRVWLASDANRWGLTEQDIFTADEDF